MAENKLEEIIDLLAEYGGFDRDYLRDKLLSHCGQEKQNSSNKMEHVAAMNNFDKLLGKNGELVEMRKEQVLHGAMEIIQRHYADKPNKMEVVAAMFGKKLGEPFRVKVRKMEEPFEAMITESGIVVTYDNWPSGILMQLLLIGEAVIVDE